jgi:hypothetical protein
LAQAFADLFLGCHLFPDSEAKAGPDIRAGGACPADFFILLSNQNCVLRF